MSTFEFSGPVDPNTWKFHPPMDESPEAWRSLWRQQKELAQHCRRYGIKGHKRPDGSLKQPGRTTIARLIEKKFPKETQENAWKGYHLAGESTVDKWTRGIDFVPDEEAYSQSDIPRQWRSYVARLSMISESCWGRPLTSKEAETAQYAGSEFQDRLGTQVDLLAQLAVVRAIVRAEQRDDTVELERFEVYFACAPWVMSRDIYSSRLDGLDDVIFLPDFLLALNSQAGWKHVSPVCEDALRQLGLPQIGFWFDISAGRLVKTNTDPHYGNEAYGRCSWEKVLESNSVNTAGNTDSIISEALDKHPFLEGWFKGAGWKELERIDEEKIND